MEFRFNPRQLGVYGKTKKRLTEGKAQSYEPKDLVTEEEVSRTINSTITPYRHKAAEFDSPSANDPWPHSVDALPDAAPSAEREAEIRSMAEEVIIDVESKSPVRYTQEAEPKGDGIISRAVNRLRPEEETHAIDNPSLGTDADGKIIFENDIIAMIHDEMERRRAERLPLELQWQLNSNFYDGNQYCDINIAARDILPLSVCEGEEDNSHEVFNRIAPLIETRIANLKKINYAMEVRPATNESDDYQKAKVSTAVLRNAQANSNFNAKKDSLILWNEICGSCFWLAWWDPTKGNEHVRFKERYVDENGETAYRDRVVFDGDVDYGLLTPYEVYPESIFKQTVADQRSIIIEQVRTVDEIESLYGIRVEGTEVDSFTLTPTPGALGPGYAATVISMGKAKMKNCQRVLTYFERRSKAFPFGRMAVLVGDNDLVYYGPLPTDDIPIIRTVCKERAGQFFGKSVIQELIPLQRAYNTASNDIADILRKSKNCQYIVFENQVDIDDFEQQAGVSNAILIYKGDPNFPPIRQPALVFSGEVFQQKHDLESQMEYVAAVSQLMVYGQTPSGVTSGTAIESLRDIDNTRLALTGDYIRSSVAEMGRLWLALYKKYAIEYRIIKYTGKNDLGAVIVWNRDDITSYDVTFTTENELMTSENNQWQRITQLLTIGISDERLIEEAVEKARDFIKSGKYDSAQSINELQTQSAARENAMLSLGYVPEVNDYDNHKLHAEEHLKYILQAEFMAFKHDKPTLAEAMIEHWKQHKAILDQNQQAIMAVQAGGNNNGI